MTTYYFQTPHRSGTTAHLETIRECLARMEQRAAIEKDPVESLRASIARRVRVSREDRNMSQGKLAKAMNEKGFSSFFQPTVTRIEDGSRQVRLDEAFALADIFGWSLDSFCPRPKPSSESGSVQR